MSNQTSHCFLSAICCGAIVIASLFGISSSFADDGESDRPEAARDRGDRTENTLRDGDRERTGPRDGERIRSMRERLQQARPDGPFSGRPAEAGGQRGAMASPMFRALDRNGDGRIDAGELDLAIASLRTLDRNNDGQLTVQELLPSGQGQMGMARPGTDQRPGMGLGDRRPEGDRPGMTPGQIPSVEQMFSQLDRNSDGSISKDEAPGRLAENFERADQDGDGKLSKDEIRTARERMTQMAKRGRDGRGESNDPAGGTRPRRPETEE